MRRVGINVLDTVLREAQTVLAFGTMVKKGTSAGQVTYGVDSSNTVGTVGVVDDSEIEQPKDGFYAANSAVPIITSGRVNIIVEGGGTDTVAGEFLKIGNDFGMLIREGTTKAVSTSVAKALEDEEVSDYTAGTMSGTSGTKTVTHAAATGAFQAGDMVMLDGGSGAVNESELAIVDSVTDTTHLVLKENMAYTYAGDDIHKCIQIEVILI